MGPRETLVDVFHDFAGSSSAFLTYDDGLRSRTYTYADVARAARAFAARLTAEGVKREQRIVFWSENRPEWIAALWGCLLAGVVVVPVDYRASPDLVATIRKVVDSPLVLHGDDVEPPPFESSIRVWRMAGLMAAPGPALDRATPSETAEILFTSGATAQPKGVVITHRNVLANIVPVEREVQKYLRYARPFAPIRFLNLLPLSHMFGQAMATFIPPMLGGVVVFMSGFNPEEIARQIRTRRVSVLVAVPKILEVLRDYVIAVVPEAAETLAGKPHWLRRWWHYRRAHRLFGWKFWSFVTGAAALDPELEEFWKRLGFVVIQGYGLTETAPIVTLNHPFHTKKGAVGTPIGGVEVRIAEDGEVLVRGPNVTTGYFNAPEADAEAFEGGWFHTGDIGWMDEEGRLYIRGRKKEMIVTPEGMNVFPEDVEKVLREAPGVRDCGVVGASGGGGEHVHAVVVLESGARAEEAVRHANLRLEQHQKIRGVSEWPGPELPRTEGTGKLKRKQLQQWVAGTSDGVAPAARGAPESVEAIVARYARDRNVTGSTTIDELGLSSLDRVGLMMEIERHLGAPVDEARFAAARTVADLTESKAPAGAPEPIAFPAWNRRWPARWIRRAFLPMVILPLTRLFAWIRVAGREPLGSLEGPVIFAANHQSHMDTPAILAALPARWRYRVAPAMSREFFRAHFHPAGHSLYERFIRSLQYYLSALVFNAFPLPQRESGARDALRYAGELVSDGWSILIFPEGRRTDAGEINRFQPGVAMLGAKLGVPVVPVRIEGLDRVLHTSAGMARPGRVHITFGRPLLLEGGDYAALAQRIEQAVRAL
ncbi:MAG: AMP-binding protein [Bryobacteraceae bacterium]